MNNTVTNEEFLKRLYDRHKDEYKLIGKYEHSQKKITLLHNKCGMTTEILPSNALSFRLPIPCKYCNPHSKKDTDIFMYQLNLKYPNEFSIVDEYKGANKPITLFHKECGKAYTYERASGVLGGIIHCPFCHKGSNYNTDSFTYKIQQKYNGEYSVISDYINSRTPILVVHNTCGFQYNAVPNEIMRGRCLCPVCTKNASNKTDDSIRIELRDKYGDKFELLDKFITINDCYNFKCKSCGRVSNLRLAHVLSNYIQCPYCGDGISYPEKFMRSVLEQLDVDYIPEYSSKDCDWCGKYRYDFYLPIYNWIIEVHGLQHYYGGWDLESVQESDRIKQQLALDNNINNYVVIDARKSEVDYIKNSIINSSLSNFKLDIIDWNLCNISANKFYFSDIVDLWNNGYEASDIANKLDISLATVYRKLADANKTNLLSRKYGGYSTARAKAMVLRNSKKVECIETGQIFNSAKEADIYYSPNNNNHENVGHCARGQQKTAYGLHWKYIV